MDLATTVLVGLVAALIAGILAVVLRGRLGARANLQDGSIEVDAERAAAPQADGAIRMKKIKAGRNVGAKGSAIDARKVTAKDGDVTFDANSGKLSPGAEGSDPPRP